MIAHSRLVVWCKLAAQGRWGGEGSGQKRVLAEQDPDSTSRPRVHG